MKMKNTRPWLLAGLLAGIVVLAVVFRPAPTAVPTAAQANTAEPAPDEPAHETTDSSGAADPGAADPGATDTAANATADADGSTQTDSTPRSGRIISAQHEVTYSPAQVDSHARRLFGTDTPSANHGVDIYRLEFESIDLSGQPTTVYAQLFVPRLSEPAGRPVYVFGAGTTGLTDLCRTSREHEAGVNWGLYRNHLLAHAGQGIIGILPDYMHFGDPGELQPYFVPAAEGRVMLDAARAVYGFFSVGYHGAVPLRAPFLAGFSQGGHAIFAAADMAASYAPELDIAGLIGYGSTTDIEDIFREFTVVAAPIIYTYARLYGEDRFDPAVMLQDRWLNNLAIDIRRLCILGLQDYYPWGPDSFFRPDFLRSLRNRSLAEDFPAIHAILRENRTGLSGHGIPALILQGGNDVVINLDDQQRFVSQLRDTGSEVRYLVYPGSRHDTRQIGFSDALDWMLDHAELQEHRP